MNALRWFLHTLLLNPTQAKLGDPHILDIGCGWFHYATNLATEGHKNCKRSICRLSQWRWTTPAKSLCLCPWSSWKPDPGRVRVAHSGEGRPILRARKQRFHRYPCPCFRPSTTPHHCHCPCPWPPLTWELANENGSCLTLLLCKQSEDTKHAEREGGSDRSLNQNGYGYLCL